MKDNILITGGAGYIGSKLSYDLTDKGYNVVVVDNLSTGSKKLINPKVKFIKANILDKKKIFAVIKKYKTKIIFHLAASLDVNESMIDPIKYYLNNVVGTESLIKDASKKNLIKKVIFSSTCAVYGDVKKKFVNETHECSPVSHYGKSKFLSEILLKNYSKEYNFSVAILRYFNVIGADQSLRCGIINDSNQLVKKLNRNTIKKNYEIDIYGNDYNTKDGTCIRDYIDVNDLSNIHIDVMKNLKKNQSITLNCGYKNGYSVNDIVDNFEKCIDHKITRKIKKRRLGDIESIVSNNLKLVKFIKKQYRGDLTNSLINSIKWEKKIKKEANLS